MFPSSNFNGSSCPSSSSSSSFPPSPVWPMAAPPSPSPHEFGHLLGVSEGEGVRVGQEQAVYRGIAVAPRALAVDGLPRLFCDQPSTTNKSKPQHLFPDFGDIGMDYGSDCDSEFGSDLEDDECDGWLAQEEDRHHQHQASKSRAAPLCPPPAPRLVPCELPSCFPRPAPLQIDPSPCGRQAFPPSPSPSQFMQSAPQF